MLESINDQENADAVISVEQKEATQETPAIITKKTNNCTVMQKDPAKRKLDSCSDVFDRPAKKTKPDKKTKVSKKKVIPLQKGQKQLTAFFRL